MASAPQPTGLPILYKDLVPLSSDQHADWGTKSLDGLHFLKGQHAVPIVIDEFVQVQRSFPIIFADADYPVPLALMGLNEGVNVFLDADDRFSQPLYVPAYIRRYPFMLAQLGQNPQELSLCFDPTSGAVGPDGEAVKLFENGQPSQGTKDILSFCEQFEQGAQRTGAFIKELQDLDLLMDGEVSIQPEGATQPHIYRGFKMVNEEKLRDLRGDQLRKMMQSGMLTLIMAHLFSLDLMREIYGRQAAQGKLPPVGVPA
ncbi:multidrug transporter [Sphingomonas sp. MAH-20]|uniref:Multidrug transporter n=1 Tax=Sphingomonas horti TaxID=2682842 RepID=A0A6I4J057_9SPHN|nr:MULTISPECIES: SapC family protein [Sphingomonas]MBA2920062.1 SapC family protein [Sphingomonas sp. CGMCC 1.13658]MVO77942.1 multidrug transporter [Sphingomonas horti]